MFLPVAAAYLPGTTGMSPPPNSLWNDCYCAKPSFWAIHMEA